MTLSENGHNQSEEKQHGEDHQLDGLKEKRRIQTPGAMKGRAARGHTPTHFEPPTPTHFELTNPTHFESQKISSLKIRT